MTDLPPPHVFISFDFDNNETHKNLFAGQCKSERTPFEIKDWSAKEPMPQSQWEMLVKDKINKCHAAVVLVGKSTHRAVGVEKEIKMAKEQNVPYFGVYVDGANAYTPLPNGLDRGRVIDWSWRNIESALNQMMTEGKNTGRY